MKGAIQSNHIPVNKFLVSIEGIDVGLTPLEVSGTEEEILTVQLPDFTTASGGRRNPTEFTMTIPMHHESEVNVMEIWYNEATDPISPTYKKEVTIIMQNLQALADEELGRSFEYAGCFPKMRKIIDLDRSDDGEMATIEYTISVDQVIPFVTVGP